MWNALFAFGDPSHAREAERALLRAGFPAERIHMHRRYTGEPDGATERLDEQLTGGVVTNLMNLFQGVFDFGGSPHDAASYEAVVNRGGIVLDVRATDKPERVTVDRTLADTDARRTEWREMR